MRYAKQDEDQIQRELAELPEITEVEWLTLKPGDVLFLHVDEKLTPATAARLREHLAAIIARPDVKIAVLDRGMTVKVGERP